MLLLNRYSWHQRLYDWPHLHFNMLLLNLFLNTLAISFLFWFTFQYASIKPRFLRSWASRFADLHFNMLLLNQLPLDSSLYLRCYLHFNMLLLNPISDLSFVLKRILFTFQYASIKPYQEVFDDITDEDLHFNMLLLNLITTIFVT